MKDKNTFPVAVHIFLEMEGKVLLLKRKGTGFHDGEWSVPAGRKEEGESDAATAVREAQEEIGIVIDPADLSRPYTMFHDGGQGGRIYIFFRCRKWTGEPKNMEPDKCAEISWHDAKNLPKDIIQHIRKAFEAIV